MTSIYLSVVVLITALTLAIYSRRRRVPAPQPVTASAPEAAVTVAAGCNPDEAFTTPWPPDEAAELLEAWRDQTAI